MDISVIVPLYRGKKYINKIIEMINLNAEMINAYMGKRAEIIFVNDFPEESISASDISGADIPVKIVINKKNQGIHQSRVNGLREATGEFVLFLDQDDDIYDNYLCSQIEKIGNADAVLCNGIYRGNKIIYKDAVAQQNAACKEEYHKQNAIVSPGQVLIRKDAIPDEWKVNILKENGSDDVLLWLLMLKRCGSFSINTEVLYRHNEDGENTSLNFEKMSKSVKELLSVVPKLFSEEDVRLIKSVHEPRMEKYAQYIKVLGNWASIIGNLENLISSKKYSKIAIYGNGIVGQKLFYSLKDRGIKIDIFIDKNVQHNQSKDYVVKDLKQINEIIDLVIITPLFDRENIVRDLKNIMWIKNYILINEQETEI